MGRTDVRAVLKCYTTESGERFATTPGTEEMLTWCAVSSGAAEPPRPWEKPSLVKAQEKSSWTKCSAKGMKLFSGSAPMTGGSPMTAFTRKMPVSSAEVTRFIDIHGQ